MKLSLGLQCLAKRWKHGMILISRARHYTNTPINFCPGTLIESGKSINHLKLTHALLIKNGMMKDTNLFPKLVSKYSFYGNIKDAKKTFLASKDHHNIYLWSSIISACVRNDLCKEALDFYIKMQEQGIEKDAYIFSSAIKACAEILDVKTGIKIHDDVLKRRFEDNIVVGTALISMYCKFGYLDTARQVFDKMREKNMVSWSALISGYAQNKQPYEALGLFNQFLRQGMALDLVVMVGVLPAITMMRSIKCTDCVHGIVVKCGFKMDYAVGTGLVDLYANCLRIDYAERVFEELPNENCMAWWNALIAGYVDNDLPLKALEIFNTMRGGNMKPNLVTMSSIIPAIEGIELGKCVHCYIVLNGICGDVMMDTCLIGMYAKCGDMKSSFRIFNAMPTRNVVSWNAVISGYAHNFQYHQALGIFSKMGLQNVKPDLFTIGGVLAVCADISALDRGRQVHAFAIREELHSDVVVCNSLVDMYAKCGVLESARKLFDGMSNRSIVSWNTIIGVHGMHGRGEEAISLFMKMEEEGHRADDVTFICLLTACSHSGLVDEGKHYFSKMVSDYGIEPSLEHYSCMVDLMGRSGRLKEACQFIEAMPLKSDAVVWGALLGACRIHGNVSLGEYAKKKVIELAPKDTWHNVLLSNMFSEAGRCEDAASLRNSMKAKRIKKIRGCSWIEISNVVHNFPSAVSEVESMIKSMIKVL